MRAPGGPRLLLRRLREVMAEPVTAQARLDRIVVLIASNMVAEVCSLYVVRADGAMELFATEGLNREAVHLTTMRPGEGLVGLIVSSAEPLALSDAQHHPAFSYRPETGEEIYQSFLGVPVLRGGATIGELVRLETAISAMRPSVDDLIDRNDDGVGGEHRDVLEAFRMIAHDRGWLRRLREAVSSGLTAEAAVERVHNDARAKLQRQTDPYLRDRLHDLTDIANRLLHQLAGQSLVLLPDELPENAILVARSMSPAALLDYDRARLRGLVLEEAGASSHIAIVARALGVPAVSDIANISEIVEHGDAIIVDGDAGEIHLRPPADVEAAYAEKARMRARRQAQYRALRDTPTATVDGVSIGLHMNAGLLVDMPHLAETGAQSIGLFRRALRIGLARPALLRMQFRAFIRAAAGRDLKIMAPMVSTVGEYRTARAMFDRELNWSQSRGHEPPRTTSLGVMVEVPSLLWQLDEIAAAADFLSVGSNDLMQYLYAVDRDNSRGANRFDPLSVGFLRALRSIAEAGARHGTPVTLCGEMGGQTLEAMALMAIRDRQLSMSATSIGPVKAMTLSLDIGEVEREVEAMLAKGREDASLREPLQRLAERLQVRL